MFLHEKVLYRNNENSLPRLLASRVRDNDAILKCSSSVRAMNLKFRKNVSAMNLTYNERNSGKIWSERD